VRLLKTHAVFMSEKPARLFGVLALLDPFEELPGKAPLPIMVQAVLLPFRDRIIYDGIMGFYRITFGAGIRWNLSDQYSILKESNGIIVCLVDPEGKAQARSIQTRRIPPRSAPDWRHAIDRIVAQVQIMRPTDTRLQGAALQLLRATAALARATLQQGGEGDEPASYLRSVRRALTNVETQLQQRW
jgi:hypothetical protein